MSENAVVKEFVKNLSDSDLQNLHMRFKQLLCGDRSTIANQLSQNGEMDRWLVSAPSATAWFNMVDEVGEVVAEEHSNRFGTEKDR